MTNINKDLLNQIYNSKPSQPPKPPRKIRWGMITFIVFMIFFSTLFGFSIAVISRFMLFETILTLFPGEKLIPSCNILVLGIDKGREIHRSDSIIVVNLDPQQNQANILAIPRDTLVSIPGRGLDKVNHAYAYGEAELTRRTVENFLNIKVPYYITLNIGALEKIIDEIGGVKIDVKKRMYYVDYAQNLYVDLKPGTQKLSGRDSLSYLRFRHDNAGDIGRIQRQQKFMKALTQQIMHKNGLFRSPQIVLKFLSFMQTNLNAKEILGFTLSMKKIYDFGQINMDSLSGDPMLLGNIFYLKSSDAEVQKIVNKYFRKKELNDSKKTPGPKHAF